MNSAEAESQAVEQAVQGDGDALRMLLAQHGPRIRNELKIARRWQPLLDPDDVMQVTYLEAFLNIRSFVPAGPDSFLAWLRRIARNNLVDTLRELESDRCPPPERRVTPSDDSYSDLFEQCGGTTTTPSRQAARHEIRELVESAISRLPPAYEQVVRLFNIQGQSAAEVAQQMGRSVGAVYLLRMRAHQRLREELGSSARYFSDGA